MIESFLLYILLSCSVLIQPFISILLQPATSGLLCPIPLCGFIAVLSEYVVTVYKPLLESRSIGQTCMQIVTEQPKATPLLPPSAPAVVWLCLCMRNTR